MRFSKALRTVALIEAAKGALVLLAGFGLLSLIHHDVQRFAERLIAHFYLNPAAHYPQIFVHVATQLTDERILLIAAGASVYSFVRFIEAYGLWYARRWAEWFAALSGGIYIPFELFGLYEGITWLRLVTLALNAVIVAIMLYGVFRSKGEGSVNLV